MIRKLLSYVKAYRKQSILAPAFMTAEVLLEITIPFVMAKMVNDGMSKGDLRYTMLMGALMVALGFFSMIMGALSGRFAAHAGAGFAANLRSALFEKVQDFSFKNIDHFATSSLVMRLTTDITNVQNTYMMCLRMAVRSPIMMIGATAMAVNLNARLSLIFFIAVPVLGGIMALIMVKGYPLFGEMLKKYDLLNATVQENLTAIRVVKAFVREDYEQIKFDQEAQAVKNAQARAERLIIWAMPIMQLCLYGCIMAVLWFGGNMVIGSENLIGGFRIGDLISFISYCGQILMSLMMLSMVFMMLVVSRACAVRIVEVLDEPLDITDEDANTQLRVKDGSITFEQVSFSYGGGQGKMALENIDFTIESGQTVGILGGTGSGKTTLVQLIPRLYDATKGHVRVGGQDVRDYTLDELRKNVSMVLQNNELFSGTIRDNLKWGDENATDEEIIAACKSARAHDFITSFPDGYDTDLSRGGVNLSGGQKQRLCIARALLKKPKVLILDDSTSAVDTATDAAIRCAFSQQIAGTTKLIIAQRVTSVMEADKIIILDDGRISAMGDHETLMRESAIYREVYDSQQKGVA